MDVLTPRGFVIAAAISQLPLAAAPTSARVFATPEAAMARAFPTARIERRTLVLTASEATALGRRARVADAPRLATAMLAWRGDTLVASGYVDTRRVRTMPATFLTIVRPDSTVDRVDVLAFHEPPDYLPPQRWLGLFGRRRLSPGLEPRRDIVNLGGASLSARATAESVRLALALWESKLAGAPLMPATMGTAR